MVSASILDPPVWGNIDVDNVDSCFIPSMPEKLVWGCKCRVGLFDGCQTLQVSIRDVSIYYSSSPSKELRILMASKAGSMYVLNTHECVQMLRLGKQIIRSAFL